MRLRVARTKPTHSGPRVGPCRRRDRVSQPRATEGRTVRPVSPGRRSDEGNTGTHHNLQGETARHERVGVARTHRADHQQPRLPRRRQELRDLKPWRRLRLLHRVAVGRGGAVRDGGEGKEEEVAEGENGEQQQHDRGVGRATLHEQGGAHQRQQPTDGGPGPTRAGEEAHRPRGAGGAQPVVRLRELHQVEALRPHPHGSQVRRGECITRMRCFTWAPQSMPQPMPTAKPEGSSTQPPSNPTSTPQFAPA